jgi:hypothetical protein
MYKKTPGCLGLKHSKDRSNCKRSAVECTAVYMCQGDYAGDQVSHEHACRC